MSPMCRPLRLLGVQAGPLSNTSVQVPRGFGYFDYPQHYAALAAMRLKKKTQC